MTKYIIILFLSIVVCCKPKLDKGKLEEQWLMQRGQLEKLTRDEKYEQAFALANERLIIAKEHFADDFRLSNAYNDLGMLYLETNDYLKAEPYLKKALSIKNTEGKNLGVIYANLGTYHSGLYQLDSAHYYLTKAMTEYKKEVQLDTTAVTDLKLDIVKVLTLKKQYEQSRQLLSEVSDYGIAKKDTNLINSTVHATGLLYLMEANYSSALEAYTQLSHYYQRKNRPAKYADNLNNIATVLAYQFQFDRAIDSIQKAAQIKLDFYRDSSMVALEMKNIAAVYDFKKDTVKAKEYREIFEKIIK